MRVTDDALEFLQVREVVMSMEVASIRQQMLAMDRQQAVQPNDMQRIAEMQRAEIDAAVEQIQKIAGMFNRELKFQVNDEIKRVVVKVIDTSTDKVIREIPSQEIQRLQLQVQETVGLLFDKSM